MDSFLWTPSKGEDLFLDIPSQKNIPGPLMAHCWVPGTPLMAHSRKWHKYQALSSNEPVVSQAWARHPRGPPLMSHSALHQPFISHVSAIHHPCINHSSAILPSISHESAIHQPISHVSTMYQPCISHASAIHQPYISHSALHQPWISHSVSDQPFTIHSFSHKSPL